MVTEIEEFLENSLSEEQFKELNTLCEENHIKVCYTDEKDICFILDEDYKFDIEKIDLPFSICEGIYYNSEGEVSLQSDDEYISYERLEDDEYIKIFRKSDINSLQKKLDEYDLEDPDSYEGEYNYDKLCRIIKLLEEANDGEVVIMYLQCNYLDTVKEDEELYSFSLNDDSYLTIVAVLDSEYQIVAVSNMN